MESLEFTINANTIIGAAGFLTALGVLVGFIKSYVKQINKWNGYDEQIGSINDDIKGLRNEQYMQTRVLMATLDGLHQLGCNGKVTEASEELSDYLNKRSHDKEV